MLNKKATARPLAYGQEGRIQRMSVLMRFVPAGSCPAHQQADALSMSLLMHSA